MRAIDLQAASTAVARANALEDAAIDRYRRVRRLRVLRRAVRVGALAAGVAILVVSWWGVLR
jgi:hypothetical protein